VPSGSGQMPDIVIRGHTAAGQPAGRTGGTRRPSPVDPRRPVHRPRRSRDRLRRLSGPTGTDRVLGAGTGGSGRGTDRRGRTGQAELAAVTAGRRGHEIGQLLIERPVSGTASRGYLAVRRPAARNISTIREFHHAGFRTRPGFRLRHDARRQPAAAGRRSWTRLHRMDVLRVSSCVVPLRGPPARNRRSRTYCCRCRPVFPAGCDVV